MKTSKLTSQDLRTLANVLHTLRQLHREVQNAPVTDEQVQELGATIDQLATLHQDAEEI